MSEDRYWPLDAANEQNRIAEVAAAAKLPLVGLVDERFGGVIGYVTRQEANVIVDALNAMNAASDALDDGWEISLDHRPGTDRYYVALSAVGPVIDNSDESLVPALLLALLAAGYGQPE